MAPCGWSAPVITLGHNYRGSGAPEGLRYWAGFVSPTEEAALVESLDKSDWLRHLKSRAQQFFGLVYYQTTHDLPALQPGAEEWQRGRPLTALPSWLLPRVVDTGVFGSLEEVNQVAANEYRRNMGISHHVEDPTSFGANLATLSLLAPVELTLTPTEEDMSGRDGVDHGNWVKVLLEPRSLLVLQGESRYAYRHGIRRSMQVPLGGGETLRRDGNYRRVSLTFRELLESRRKLLNDAAADVAAEAPPSPPSASSSASPGVDLDDELEPQQALPS